MMPLRLLPWLGIWLLMTFATLTTPALAQTADNAAENDQASYSTLADLLENRQSRQELIDLLRNQAAGVGDESSSAAQDSDAEDASIPRQIAEMTSKIVSDVGEQLEQALYIVTGLFTGEGGGTFDSSAFIDASINLGMVVLATFILFVVFRQVCRPLFSKLSLWSRDGYGLTPVLRLILCVAVAALIDVLIVAFAYVGGNLIATFAIGQTGDLSTRASLFLNAFLVIELIKAAVRMLFSSRYEGLRLLPVPANEASYWNRWLARLVGMVGYGLMVAVPLVNYYLAPTLGQALGTLIMVFAFIYAVTVILKNRVRLRDSINDLARSSSFTASRVTLQLFARTWHLFALLYFLMVFVLTLTRPVDALPFVLFATLQTLAAVVAGILISSFLTQTIGRRITLSSELRQKLPLLEKRLNSYVPNGLRVLRSIIAILVIMVVLDAWGAFDLPAWYASDSGTRLISKLINVTFILILSIGIWLGLASLIEHKLNPDTGSGEPTARARTLLSLFRNALAIAVVTLTGMIVLSEIGINIGPLIAGAGVLGLAIGFGAQKLVQDVITGIFIQVENAMNAGDVVTVGGITGTAEKLSIRSVGIRDLSGTYHIVPFSSVDTVSNYMRDYGNHLGEYSIAYRESIDEAVEQLHLAFEDLKASEEHGFKLLAPLEVPGVVALADSSVNIRVVIKTTPGDQWAVGRAYNRLVKLRFDQAGIEIPFPHTTMYFGADKAGKSPAANIRVLDAMPDKKIDVRQDDPKHSIQTSVDASNANPSGDEG
ncbi:MAG: mechanosensitive channel protein [Halomonas sp.]|nr:mechanosensitive channel protein [Halomonas sp.]TVM04983.1 MAG: mechanosensitive channel protein [Halomonas sp.]